MRDMLARVYSMSTWRACGRYACGAAWATLHGLGPAMEVEDGDGVTLRESARGLDPRKSENKAKLAEGTGETEVLAGLGPELRVVWMPGRVRHSAEGMALSGEVQGSTILIYEEDEAESLKALRHEIVDYVISHEVEAPYKDLINKLIDAFQAEAYRRKERLVERLTSSSNGLLTTIFPSTSSFTISHPSSRCASSSPSADEPGLVPSAVVAFALTILRHLLVYNKLPYPVLDGLHLLVLRGLPPDLLLPDPKLPWGRCP